MVALVESGMSHYTQPRLVVTSPGAVSVAWYRLLWLVRISDQLVIVIQVCPTW